MDFLDQFFSYIQHSSTFENRMVEHYYIDSVLDVYQTHCKIEEGEPDSGSYSFSVVDIYTLSHEEIKHFIDIYLKDEQNETNIMKLVDMGVIRDSVSFQLKPYATLFGFIIYQYIQNQFIAQENEGIIDVLQRLDFDKTIFESFFTETMKYMVEDFVQLEYYYFIYGIRVSEKLAIFDDKRGEKVLRCDNKFREDMIKKFSFKRDKFTGIESLMEKVDWIVKCSSVICGTFNLDKKRIKEDNKNFGILKYKETNLLVPIYLEEAFFLLGYDKPLVHFVSLIPKNYFGYIEFYVNPRGLHYSLGGIPGLRCPSWMNQTMREYRNSFGKVEDFLLSQDNLMFLRLYPEFRFNLRENSVERLVLNRFHRLMDLSNPLDIILESCIIFESITTSEPKEIGYQLRIKLAWLLAKKYENKEIIVKIVKILYKIRSDIVHNGGIKSEKYAKKLGGLHDAADISRRMVKLLIIRILIVTENQFKIIPRDELTSILDKLMLGLDIKLPDNPYFTCLSAAFFEEISETLNF